MHMMILGGWKRDDDMKKNKANAEVSVVVLFEMLFYERNNECIGED